MIGRTLLPALALALLAGCGYDATPPERAPDPAAAGAAPAAPAESTPAPAAQPLLVREDPGHLADASGAALYFLEGNRDGRRCDDACEQVWPPVTSDVPNPSAGPGVDASAVGTLQGGDGRNHVTYGGEPLYRYAGDRGARTTTGDDVEDEWGRWRLVTLGEGQ
ncbi:hypothetical protein [Luteimonas wenzhouensis]|uniref:Lipoprotein with Yx(FWY)xxD motif n=1 Tax=Luteimonas wenzhouensis TaxID=2599615 RepID=A0A5C5U5A4_9GAMM|nr:hypothetical protein [Luteimonas wenzhouensis]TWT20675.1 hypothetical protein FQY79_04940 [Luteimonas wenzhouensis]